jgi:hypothetical protein
VNNNLIFKIIRIYNTVNPGLGSTSKNLRVQSRHLSKSEKGWLTLGSVQSRFTSQKITEKEHNSEQCTTVLPFGSGEGWRQSWASWWQCSAPAPDTPTGDPAPCRHSKLCRHPAILFLESKKRERPCVRHLYTVILLYFWLKPIVHFWFTEACTHTVYVHCTACMVLFLYKYKMPH